MDPARILVEFGDPAAWPTGRADLTLGTRFNHTQVWWRRVTHTHAPIL